MASYAPQGSIFEQLSAKVRDCLLAKARTRTFDRGSTICLQGEATRTLKVVQSGWVKLYRISQNGGEAILATLKEGQSFDEIASLQGRHSSASAQAVSDCTILYLDPSSVFACQDAHREIMTVVLAAASGHIEALMDDVERLKVKTGVERLSDYLLSLAESSAENGDIELPFEKNLLAGKLGMKPESLSRAFGRLKPFGVAIQQRKVTIKSVDALRSFSEGVEGGMLSVH